MLWHKREVYPPSQSPRACLALILKSYKGSFPCYSSELDCTGRSRVALRLRPEGVSSPQLSFRATWKQFKDVLFLKQRNPFPAQMDVFSPLWPWEMKHCPGWLGPESFYASRLLELGLELCSSAGTCEPSAGYWRPWWGTEPPSWPPDSRVCWVSACWPWPSGATTGTSSMWGTTRLRTTWVHIRGCGGFMKVAHLWSECVWAWCLHKHWLILTPCHSLTRATLLLEQNGEMMRVTVTISHLSPSFRVFAEMGSAMFVPLHYIDHFTSGVDNNENRYRLHAVEI